MHVPGVLPSGQAGGPPWPDATASLREGMSETLTLMRLGIDRQLAKSLCSTNPCESMIEIVR
jgi:putative transposase